VSSGGEGTVQVIDTASNAIIAAIPVGKRPWNMAITPDGRKLYVACGRSNAIAVVDTATNAKIADIAVGDLPWGVALR
jgi:YVTN family beta-propeller protein